MTPTIIQLKKGEARRIQKGHPWVYSNEINTKQSPLSNYNAGDEVVVEAHDHTYLGRGFINPHSLIAVRLFSRDPDITLDVDFFSEQLWRAKRLRDQLFAAPYYRLVYAEADNLPGLIIDRFANHFVAQVNTAGMEIKKPLLIAALRQVFPEMESLYLRNDSAIRQQEGLPLYGEQAYGTTPETLIIHENECQFVIPLLSGQKTGWFYDHRYNRKRLQAYVRDKRVLDVFSYLGGFAIHAAFYGAKEVDCIEVSESATQFIQQNAALNAVSSKLKIVRDDAFIALKKLQQAGNHYDVIVLDPPAFIKKRKDREQGIIAYLRLHELALRLLTQDGILISCSCSMQLAEEDLLNVIQRAAQRTNTSLQILERRFQGPDHPLHPLIH